MYSLFPKCDTHALQVLRGYNYMVSGYNYFNLVLMTMMYIHHVPQKVIHQLISITQSILNGFSKFLHCHTLWKMWDKRIIKDFTIPKTCRCTILWNINFQKLLELKHGNRKLSAH